MTAIELQNQRLELIEKILQYDSETLHRLKEYMQHLKTSESTGLTLQELGVSEELFKSLTKQSERDYENQQYQTTADLIRSIKSERQWK